MRRWALGTLVAAASCAGMSVQPHAAERTRDYLETYVVEFEVACDSCRVEYGREGSTFHDVVDGGWNRGIQVGPLRSGSRARLVLHIVPIGQARVVNAGIAVDGRTVTQAKDKKPGKAITLRTTIRSE